MTLPVGFVHGSQSELADASQESDGAAFNAGTGMIQSAESAPVPIYVQSPFTGAAVHAGGDDKYAEYPISEVAGDVSKRLRSEHGVERLLKRATNGRMIELIYLGNMVGGVESTTEARVIFTRRLRMGGGEAGRIPIARRGPKNWLPIQSGIGGFLTNLEFLGGGGGNITDTRATFPAATFGTDIRGWWLQQEANGSGRKVYFEIPIRKNDDHQIWIDALLSGADLNGDVVIGNAHNSMVTPGVLIQSDTDDASDVLIEGFGPFAFGSRGTTTTAKDNPQAIAFAFRQLHLVRPRFQIVGQCILDRCLLDDNPVFASGSYGFYGCISMQLIEFLGAVAVWPVIMNQFSNAIEPCGQPEVFGQPLPPNADPIVPYNGTNLLVHGSYQLGSPYMGGPSASQRYTKILSIAPSPIEGSTAAQLTIQNRGSNLEISNSGGAYIENSGPLPCVWCKQDASMRAPFNTGGNGRVTIVDGGVAGELMVGRDRVATPPITRAALAGAPWNGRYQQAAGDDQSYIINAQWDTVDTGYNDGT